MASTPRWGGLRVESFDPDARDADGDGIVQEGTAWERPFGLQLVDELGRAIARGQTANSPLSGLQYVDRQGNAVEYKPTWIDLIGRSGEVIPEKKRKGTGLARLGFPSLKDSGHMSILDMQVAQRSTTSTLSVATAAKSIDFREDIEVKALPFQRRLRMEPYDPDAIDGDGDGIVQDGTPWERPVGTRALTESGKHFAKGTTLNRRPPGMRLVDSDGNEIAYRPKVSHIPEVGLRRLAATTERRKPQRQPVVEPPKKVTTPLGQLGFPTLRERGHADLDDFMDPPPHPPQEPVVPELRDLTDDLDTNIERIRRLDPSAFPDLPRRSDWPPALPVSPSDIADERKDWEEDFSTENAVTSRINRAIEDLLTTLDEDYEVSIPDEVAKMLLLAALGFPPDSFGPHDAGLEIDGVSQHLAELSAQRASQFLTTAANAGTPAIQTTVFDLMDIIQSGRYKSQFETGSSRGFFDPMNRASWEYAFLDQPEDLPNELRPVYGLLQVDETGFTTTGYNAARQYGNSRIILRDDVKDRALLTIGDSLGTGAQPWPIRGSDLPYEPDATYSRTSREAEVDYLLTTAMSDEMDNAGRTLELMLESMGLDVEDIFEEGELMELVRRTLLAEGVALGGPHGATVGDYPWFKSYIEMQILGGVSLYDISEIIFASSVEHDFEGSDDFKALIRVLNELGIPYRFSDPALKGIPNA